MISGYYNYLWLRDDGSPYYVGKGTRDRAYTKCHHLTSPPKDKSNILIVPMISQEEALEYEKRLIAIWGRKDLGTGCLHNFTDGGDVDRNVSPETCAKISAAQLGVPRGPYKTRSDKGKKRKPHTEETKAKISDSRKGIPTSAKQKLAVSLAMKERWKQYKRGI